MGKRIIFTVVNDLHTERRMDRICSTLAAAGYEVMLLGRLLPESTALPERNYRTHRLRCWVNKGKLFYLEFNLRLLFYLCFRSFDILGTVDADTLPAGWLLRHLKRIKLVFDAHEWFSQVPEVVCRPAVQGIWEWVERKLIPAADAAYTVCSSIADHYTKISGIPFQVIMNAPPLDSNHPKHEPEEPHFILYQGALNRGRGIEAMIQALHRLDIRLVLVGEGDLSQELRELVKREGLDHKVHFAGWVAPEQLKYHTCKAWLGLNVSENQGLSYYYSLNNKFFDYIHAGLPSLINAFPEYLHLMEQWQVGIAVDSDPDALVAALKQLQEDPALYAQLEQNCREAAKTLNWQREAEKLIDIYARL
jgi:glycosyltransferase involved in cell wall biosynthesis